jgi:hypothetical protein
MDPERLKRLRAAIRYLIENDMLERGMQARLAELYDVARQRIHQLVNQEREIVAKKRGREELLRLAQLAS